MSSFGSRFSTIAWAALLFAVTVRLTTLVIGSASLQEDPDAYARIATTWAATGTMGYDVDGGGPPNPTAYRPPLYPWLLSWLVFDGKLSLLAVGAFHLAMGIATVVLTARIGRCLGLGHASWGAAAAVAIDPLLVRAGQQVMTETLATLLSTMVLYCLAIYCQGSSGAPLPSPTIPWRRRIVLQSLLGCALGLAILARPTAAPWALWILITLAFCKSENGGGWKATLSVTTIVAVVLVPWTMRNLAQFGKPIWSTTHGGYTLLLANNPDLYAHFRVAGPSREWEPSAFHAHWAALESGAPNTDQFWNKPVQSRHPPANFTEVDTDRIAYQAALSAMADEPTTFLVSCVYRVLWLWHLFPNQNSNSLVNTSIGIWYCVLFSNALFGLNRIIRRCRESGDSGSNFLWIAAIGLILTLTAVHAVFWSNMRMRSPAMPIVYLIAFAQIAYTKRNHVG